MKATSLILSAAALGALGASAASERRISVDDYRDRMEAGWIGQIAGVGVGGPTEFKYCHKIVPADKVRAWSPEIINEAFHQDDLYVEMTFLATLDRHGLGVDIRRAGIEFANSRYRLWHANAEGRDALRRGIAPPDSSHPSVNTCANDIDYQIEADYSGLVSPGCLQGVVALGEKFGRLMNYGDGMWAGQFVGAMYAAAFFEREPRRIVESALRVLPPQSRYAEMVRDLLAWHAADGADWQGAWRKIIDKYGHEGGCSESPDVIEATLNGAMVLLGVLYGNGDPYRTIVISTRGGFDSDCNPSSAAGVVFTSIGKRALPREYYERLDLGARFEYTDYNFPALVAVCDSGALTAQLLNAGAAFCFVRPLMP
ncbi:MAG: ADP-ribosylglycohydrolase family protein, partial [Kiritimatiellae bacterium]|nr:ADP-ribosylglycohydrolase family protein [Kiritimatiellia bacterium]